MKFFAVMYSKQGEYRARFLYSDENSNKAIVLDDT